MSRLVLCMVAVAALAGAAWSDPPARVGRLSFIDGAVSFASEDGGAWQPAALNFPITEGNQLSTEHGAKAEVQVGSAAVHLAPDTLMTVESLDDQSVQIRLDRGDISVRLRAMDPDQGFEIDTQSATISLSAPGSYRIGQRDSGESNVTAWSGAATVTGSAAGFDVPAGQAASIPASGPDAALVASAPPADAWDQWVAGRDSGEDHVASARYASREMNGIQDLDAYGSWRVVVGYGPCWVPASLPSGWAPYTVGHWAWIDPWGWTWVSAEPWGFAPFHYGRWAFVTGFWCWVPGPIVVHPVFAPALVRWVGGTPWRGQPPDPARVTWVPLRPTQAYHPAYPTTRAYVRAVNGGGLVSGGGLIVREPVTPAPIRRPPVAVPLARSPLRPGYQPGFVARPYGRGPGMAAPAYPVAPAHPAAPAQSAAPPYYSPRRGPAALAGPGYPPPPSRRRVLRPGEDPQDQDPLNPPGQ